MCPVASPAGASPGFDRAAAAAIVGLPPSALRRCERMLLDRAGLDLGPTLTLADLVAFAVLSVSVRCLGGAADAFAVGHARVFDALRDWPDIERLDGCVALVGRDSAQIVERYDAESCAADDTLVIPLHPILADFRGRVFA